MFRAVSSLECQKHLRCITRIDRAKDCIYNLFSFANVSISDVYSSKKKKIYLREYLQIVQEFIKVVKIFSLPYL